MDSQRFDFPSDKDELGGGLGLVSDLLELPKQFEGEETREGSVVQKGRQWFTEGASALVKGTRTLKGNEDTSVRIRRSLFRLDKVLSPDPPSHSLTSGITPTANRVGPLHAIATPLGETSMMSRSRMRDSLLALTPAQDDTFMTMSTHAGPPSSLRMEGTFLGDRDSTMVEDPARKVSGDLVLAFHREFCSHSSPSQCLDMAVALEKCCEVQWNVLTSFEKQTRWSVDQLLSELRMEMATWQLLHVLGRDRLEGGGGAEEERAPERLGRKRESDKELAERLFIQDSSVRQAQLVVDWLEGVARVGLEQYPVKAAYFTDKVCRENTLHDLSHGIDSDVLVTELDPDAPTRQKRKLSELDVKDELALNKHLFTCLRAGQLDKGLAMCVESGNPLKAVMVDGWKLHHDPNLDKKSWDKLDPVEGSEFRDLWKETCWKMVDEPAYDIYEKALYAALSGNVTKILPVCRTWYDYVWAYFKTLVDVQVEKVLRSRTLPSGREWGWLPTKYWSNALLPHQIFQEIEASPSAEIQQQCHSHFHVVQKYIILDDLIGLVDEMFSWLCEPASLSIHRLRFMAHIGLVVKNLERLREETKIHAILEAYVKALTDGHYQSQVALYAAQLPTDAQVNSYAYLLAGVHEEELQRHYLQLGKEAGLDITLVTKAVVENIREIGTGREVSAGLVELGEEVKLTEADQSKIKAIRWLVYDEVHRTEAIRQSNALIRQFLAARKFSAAQAMFQKIPPDSSELVKTVWKQKAGMNPLPEDIVSDLTEHEAIRTYLEAKDAFNVWFQYFHHKKPAMPAEPMESAAFCEKVAYEHSLARYKLEYEHWKSQTNFLVEEAYSRLHAVLVFPGGWMKGHIGVGPDADRDEGLPQQLQVLRQIYIPEIGYLLHSVLHDSVLYKKCLQISDVLTSNEYMLYEDFRPDELRQLLSRLRRSALGLTSDPSTDELGYPIS